MQGYAPNLFGALASALTSAQRKQACLAERKAQWDDYYARQRAAQEASEAAKAEQERQQAAEEAKRQAEQEEAAAAAARQAKQELHQRHLAYAALLAAEQSPDNHCKTPDIARNLISEWNDFDDFKENNIRTIDIEHLTTVSWSGESLKFTCHGIFVTNRGNRIAGSLSMKQNVAGDPIFTWSRDESQDLASYEQPPAEDFDTVMARTDVNPDQPKAADFSKDSSFAAGLADRQSMEVWISGLSGDEKDGATWWAANRSLPHHASCANAEQQANATWLAGCLNAQQRLTPIDLKRKSDPLYRKGWNSF
jgi:hypothetical protein